MIPNCSKCSPLKINATFIECLAKQFVHILLENQQWRNTLPGQLLVLQAPLPVLFPVQLAPPFAAGASIALVLWWVPPPQVLEQVSHGFHTLQVQLATNILRLKQNT